MVNDPGKNQIALAMAMDDQRQPRENGFPNRTDSSIAFDDATLTFTITPTGASFDHFAESKRYSVEAADSITITDVEGLHFIYYTEGVLNVSAGFQPSLINPWAWCATLYWDATNGEAVIFADERHGTTMSSRTHAYNHDTFGTRYGEGLALDSFTADGGGSLDAEAQFSCAEGVIWDEDIEHEITDGSPQDISPILNAPIIYRDGASGEWRKIAATAFPVTTTGTGRAAYNEWTGATWQISEAANNRYVLSHVIATSNAAEPIIVLMGQEEYSSVANARAGAQVELLGAGLGDLDALTPEWYSLGTVIYETKTSYSNAVQSIVRSFDSTSDYYDWREKKSGSGLGSGTTTWGTISGSLSDQTDLQDALDLKADDNLGSADQILTGNRNVTIASGTDYFLFLNLVDDTGANNQTASIIVQPGTPRVVITATETSVSSASFAVGSDNLNLVLVDADFSFNGDAGTAGDQAQSAGAGSPPIWAPGIVHASTAPDTSQLWYHTTDNCIYYYDTTRTKWLSTHEVQFESSSNVASSTANVIMQGASTTALIVSSNRGQPVPYMGTVVGWEWTVSKAGTTNTRELALGKYDVSAGTQNTRAYSVTPAAWNTFSETDLDVDYDTSDWYGAIAYGTVAMAYARLTVRYRRRPS